MSNVHRIKQSRHSHRGGIVCRIDPRIKAAELAKAASVMNAVVCRCSGGIIIELKEDAKR